MRLETYSLNSGSQVAESGVREMIEKQAVPSAPFFRPLPDTLMLASKSDALSLCQVPSITEHMGGAQ